MRLPPFFLESMEYARAFLDAAFYRPCASRTAPSTAEFVRESLLQDNRQQVKAM
jgi:hypothetical protein